MLRRIVREEVRSALREDLARPGGPERAVDAAPPADPLAEAATALARPEARPHAEEALATLDAAVARHRWGEADRQRFTAAVSLLEPRARVEIERRLMVAMNRDELVLDPGTSPFEAPGTGR
jgi:hypothetical protein